MTDVQSWLVAKEDLNKIIKVKVAENLPEFHIKTLTGADLDKLQKESMRIKKTRGQITQSTDERKFMSNLIEAVVVEPNLHDNEIQEYYGTIGDAAGTVRSMLTAGQYQNLVEKIQEVEGFDQEDDEIETVKN